MGKSAGYSEARVTKNKLTNLESRCNVYVLTSYIILVLAFQFFNYHPEMAIRQIDI